MADSVTVVDLIPAAIVHRILHKYAHSVATAGSQLAAVGIGRASSAAMGAAATVGMKLARTPAVEDAMWYFEAADWIKSQEGYRDRRAAGERARCEHARLIRAAAHFAWSAEHCSRHALRLIRTKAYRQQWALLTCELSACWVTDPAFRAWIDNSEG